MSARTKLNVAFINGAVLLAAVAGGLMESWSVFFIALVVFSSIFSATASISRRLLISHSSQSHSHHRDDPRSPPSLTAARLMPTPFG